MNFSILLESVGSHLIYFLYPIINTNNLNRLVLAMTFGFDHGKKQPTAHCQLKYYLAKTCWALYGLGIISYEISDPFGQKL